MAQQCMFCISSVVCLLAMLRRLLVVARACIPASVSIGFLACLLLVHCIVPRRIAIAIAFELWFVRLSRCCVLIGSHPHVRVRVCVFLLTSFLLRLRALRSFCSRPGSGCLIAHASHTCIVQRLAACLRACAFLLLACVFLALFYMLVAGSRLFRL